MLRFSYQSDGKSRAFDRAVKAVANDPFGPIGAVLAGANGLVVVSNLPVEQFKAIADAIASVLSVEAVALNSLETGDFN